MGNDHQRTEVKLTTAEKRIVDALKRGARLWGYSSHRSAWLIEGDNHQRVMRKTVESLEEAGVIFEDPNKSFYRADSGSDLVWSLKTEDKS